MKKILGISLLVVLLAGAVLFIERVKIKDWWLERQKKEVPPPINVDAFLEDYPKDTNTSELKANESEEASKPKEIAIPPSFNLDVPFTSQAPFAVWDHKDEEACEEAALLMVNRFYQKRGIAGPEEAREAIDQIIEGEKKVLSGVWESTTAEEIAKTAREFLGYPNTEVKYEPTVDDIKKAIAQGHPVIVPAAGRLLGNPFYKQPGPLYHALVIKGYTAERFITNDPGTKRGADYSYPYEKAMNAIHDWNGGDVVNGKPVMIIVKP